MFTQSPASTCSSAFSKDSRVLELTGVSFSASRACIVHALALPELSGEDYDRSARNGAPEASNFRFQLSMFSLNRVEKTSANSLISIDDPLEGRRAAIRSPAACSAETGTG